MRKSLTLTCRGAGKGKLGQCLLDKRPFGRDNTYRPVSNGPHRPTMDTIETSKASLFDDERSGFIYRTAAQMIYKKGFDAISMNEIAKALDLTKPGLYYHVKGKKQLLFSIMEFAMDLLDTHVIEPAQAIVDAEERLRLIISQHARLLTHEAGALAILIDEDAGLSEKQRRAIVQRKRAYFDLLRRTLEELEAQGRLRPNDTTVAAFSLLGMVMWISRWYNTKGRLDSEQVIHDVTEIALGGMIAPREARKDP